MPQIGRSQTRLGIGNLIEPQLSLKCGFRCGNDPGVKSQEYAIAIPAGDVEARHQPIEIAMFGMSVLPENIAHAVLLPRSAFTQK